MLFFILDTPTINNQDPTKVFGIFTSHQEAIENTKEGQIVIDRWSFKSRFDVAILSESCNEFAKSNKYIWVDKGNSISPRFDIVELPQVGDEVSYAFNGDYYPCGKITEISGFKAFELGDKAPVSCRRIVAKEENGSTHIFWRKGQSGTWLRNKTWALIKGIHNERNPSF